MVQKKDHFDLAQVVKYPYLCTRVRQLVAMVHTTPLNGRAPNASALRSDYRYTSSPPEKEKNKLRVLCKDNEQRGSLQLSSVSMLKKGDTHTP